MVKCEKMSVSSSIFPVHVEILAEYLYCRIDRQTVVAREESRYAQTRAMHAHQKGGWPGPSLNLAEFNALGSASTQGQASIVLAHLLCLCILLELLSTWRILPRLRLKFIGPELAMMALRKTVPTSKYSMLV